MLQGVELSKTYGGSRVLSPISLAVEPGTCLGLAGPNGSGKSTLMSILAQTLRPDGGDVLWQGQSILGRRELLRHVLGYVPQQNCLLDELTGREQLLYWYRCCGGKGPLPQDIVDLLSLEELYRTRIGRMSGGMRKRISIAMALLPHPPVLVMDEAFAALDGAYRQRLKQWLEDYLARGGSMLWCSHEQEELLSLCRRVLILEGGVLQFDGAPLQAADFLRLRRQARQGPEPRT